MRRKTRKAPEWLIIHLLLGLLGITLLQAPHAELTTGDRGTYKDPSLPIADRIEDLLRRMTLEEKVAQLTTVWDQKNVLLDQNGHFIPAEAVRRHPAGIGQWARPSDRIGKGSPAQIAYRDEAQTVDLVNAVQRYSIDQTRLGIPVIFHEEGLHGYAARGATSFPQAIALASTWDPELIERVYSIVGREIRARGAHLVLSPVVDVARDPRWGRIEETFGEDPFLVSEMGVAAVQGFQGPQIPLAPGKVLATLKHMTGHGQPESGVNIAPANLSERLLREVFFPPFEQAVERTNVMSIMASYNEIDGVPSHANSWLLNRLLRGEWGYQGAVVSDYFAINDMVNIHRVAADLQAAAALALKAGVDADLPDGAGYKLLPSALTAGQISQDQIDQAVRRMLRLKFAAGLFEQPFADAAYAESITANAEARELALEAARKAIVLLKNDGTLPLQTTELKRLAVVGPNAAVPRLGGYSDFPDAVVTILDGIKAQAGSDLEVIHHTGVTLTQTGDWWQDEVVLADPAENRKMIAAATELAAEADLIVAVIGGSEATSREAWAPTHLGDRTDIELVGQQQELVEALYALGKPVVLVLINGRPLGIDEIVDGAAAIVEGWYLGQEGGTAMAEVLFGEVNPGGKLPVTIPKSVGQLPMVYNHKPSAFRGYLFGSTAPLFAFGHGLSYTQFEISPPKVSPEKAGLNDEIKIQLNVSNVGNRAGDEVVQVYVRDKVSSVTRPVKELKAFQRVRLQPHQKEELTFILRPEHFRFWNIDMERVVEAGEFEILVGSNSTNLESVVVALEET